MDALTTLAAANTLSLAMGLPARAADGDERLNQTVGTYTAPQSRGLWINPHLPADQQPSADQRVHTIVAGYTRTQLDRGGWANPYVDDDHYAGGAPLLAVAVGTGVTMAQRPMRRPVSSS